MRYLLFSLLVFLACTQPVEVAEAEPQEQSLYGWRTAPTVDRFGDTTDVDGSVIGLFPGTFSNSATLGDSLIAKVQLAKDSMLIITLLEYGNVPAMSSIDNIFIPAQVKHGGGNDTIELGVTKGYAVDYQKSIYPWITSGQSAKVLIDLSETQAYSSSKYVFEITPIPVGLVR